jgi:hypothetical protein
MSYKEERFEKTFSVGESCELSLNNIQGSIEIKGWDKPEISVSGVKRARGFWGPAEPSSTIIEMKQDGSKVSIKTKPRQPFSWFNWGKNWVTVDYYVRVPRKANLNIKGVSCPIKVEDIEGDVRNKSVSGRLLLDDIKGDINLNSVSGGVTGNKFTGSLDVTTVSGGITLTNCHLSSMSANSVSGGIRLGTTINPEGRYKAKTVSGSWKLAIPPDSRCTISTKSFSGGVKCELPREVTNSSRSNWSGKINGGGATIEFNSLSGSLHIVPLEAEEVFVKPEERPSGETRPLVTEEEAPGATKPIEEESPEMNILKMVESGEIDIEEALKRLSDLE